jgi:hypothetical protein
VTDEGGFARNGIFEERTFVTGIPLDHRVRQFLERSFALARDCLSYDCITSVYGMLTIGGSKVSVLLVYMNSDLMESDVNFQIEIV